MFSRSNHISTYFVAAALVYSGAASAGPLPTMAADPVSIASNQPPLVDIDPSETSNRRRVVVDYLSYAAPGTVIIDTAETYLYFVLGDGKAIRYGIGVGRDGFTWSGTETVTRKAEWPDWTPPAEMIARQPYLARFMAGGEGNPLGARAIYLGNTVYRIHGTNMPDTIGQKVSSGCIRLLNDDVIDLYSRVEVGSKIIVLPSREAQIASAGEPQRFIAPVSYARHRSDIY